MSQRTDGGPGNQRQPLRVPSGGQYGDRKALIAQQQAAPLAAGTPTPQPQAPVDPGAFDAFRPSDRPAEPITAGIASGPGPSGQTMLPADPHEGVRALIRANPHPDLIALLDYL